MECPRCERPLSDIRITSGGGAYRGAFRLAHRCDACLLMVLDPQDVEARAGDLPKRLGQSVLLRERKRVTDGCPGCMANLEKLTLSWDSGWVEIEECPRCGNLVVDPGELRRLVALEAQASERGWGQHARSLLEALE